MPDEPVKPAPDYPYELPAWDLKTPSPPGWRMIQCSKCGTSHVGYRGACPAHKK